MQHSAELETKNERLILAALCQQVHPTLIDQTLAESNIYQYEHQQTLIRLLNEAHCPNPYRKSVLKHAIRRIEAGDATLRSQVRGEAEEHGTICSDSAPAVQPSLHEDLAEEYAFLQCGAVAASGGPIIGPQVSQQQTSEIQYRLDKDICIRIHEERDVIAANGTTGHRTWEAALALGDWIASNKERLKQSNILELGAGTGLAGLIAAKLGASETRKVVLTDGDEAVVDALNNNIQLNGIQGLCVAQKLYWGNDLLDTSVFSSAGASNSWTILAADVTYDRDLIPVLLQCVKDHMRRANVSEAIISATIRSQETFNVFTTACTQLELRAELLKRYIDHPNAVDRFFVPAGTPAIEIYRLVGAAATSSREYTS